MFQRGQSYGGARKKCDTAIISRSQQQPEAPPLNPGKLDAVQWVQGCSEYLALHGVLVAHHRRLRAMGVSHLKPSGELRPAQASLHHRVLREQRVQMKWR